MIQTFLEDREVLTYECEKQVHCVIVAFMQTFIFQSCSIVKYCFYCGFVWLFHTLFIRKVSIKLMHYNNLKLNNNQSLVQLIYKKNHYLYMVVSKF